MEQAIDWLMTQECTSLGDWSETVRNVAPGGWAFERANRYYPDIDDTPVVAWAMMQSGDARFDQALERAACWIEGMQSSNGGWASFDVDNTHYYLNEIPFADHGALFVLRRQRQRQR